MAPRRHRKFRDRAVSNAQIQLDRNLRRRFERRRHDRCDGASTMRRYVLHMGLPSELDSTLIETTVANRLGSRF
jgi:hypothetical protein